MSRESEVREYYFRGTFYPESCAEIKLLIEKFNVMLDEAIKEDDSFFDNIPRAIIVPHAGYVYSGFSANAAYRIFSQNSQIENILIFGPSHHHYFKGISIGDFGSISLKNYELMCDRELISQIKDRYGLEFVKDAHKEHSTEVQFPFVKYYFEDAKAIEFVYGDCEPQDLANILIDVLKNPKNGVVISTDLSHFYSEDEANSIDNICLHAIAKGDNSLLHRGCEACGIIGIEALISASKEMNLNPKIVDYRTSSWSSGDKSRVVGYTSAIYY